jgi:hypothetical protein
MSRSYLSHECQKTAEYELQQSRRSGSGILDRPVSKSLEEAWQGIEQP